MTTMEEAIGRILAFAARRREVEGTPGISLVLTDAATTLHVAGLGFANLEARTPVAQDQLFQIGSIGKSFAAIVAAQLHEEGRLDLHAPITTYLPWFEVRSAFEPITAHHLLTHTSGLISGSLGLVDPRAEVWALRDTEVAWRPGTAYHYSNAGYKVLGLAIAEVCGSTFPRVLAERVIEPLGMAATEPAITADVRARQATPYTPLLGDRPYRPGHPLAPATWFEDDGADGSICSTPDDMARFVRVLLGRGTTASGRRLLSSDGFRRMTSPSLDVVAKPYGYGIGLERTGNGLRLVHAGDMVGFTAHVLADVGTGLGAVVMANGPARPGLITRYAADVLAAAARGGALPDPPPIDDPFEVDGADTFAGTFADEEDRLTISSDGARLVLEHDGRRVPLERVEADVPAFFAADPRFDRALLEFELNEGRAARVWHGRRAYARSGIEPATPPAPVGWRAFEGLFRTNSPWRPSVRFVLRGDRLCMIEPPVGTAMPLEPLGDAVFRPAEDPAPPERIRFGRVLDGRALLVEIEGLEHYRSFDPSSVWNETGE